MNVQINTCAEVRNILRRWPVGQIFTSTDVAAEMEARHLPVEMHKVSAALGILSSEQYKAIKRLGKVGRSREYRLMKRMHTIEIFDGGTKRPHRKNRKRKNGAATEPVRTTGVTYREQEPNPDEPAATGDLLLNAAFEYERGNIESAMESARQGFLRMRKEQQLMAVKNKMETH